MFYFLKKKKNSMFQYFSKLYIKYEMQTENDIPGICISVKTLFLLPRYLKLPSLYPHLVFISQLVSYLVMSLLFQLNSYQEVLVIHFFTHFLFTHHCYLPHTNVYKRAVYRYRDFCHLLKISPCKFALPLMRIYLCILERDINGEGFNSKSAMVKIVSLDPF